MPKASRKTSLKKGKKSSLRKTKSRSYASRGMQFRSTATSLYAETHFHDPIMIEWGTVHGRDLIRVGHGQPIIYIASLSSNISTFAANSYQALIFFDFTTRKKLYQKLRGEGLQFRPGTISPKDLLESTQDWSNQKNITFRFTDDQMYHTNAISDGATIIETQGNGVTEFRIQVPQRSISVVQCEPFTLQYKLGTIVVKVTQGTSEVRMTREDGTTFYIRTGYMSELSPPLAGH